MNNFPFERHTWAEIDLDALRHNYRTVKARAGQTPLCPVVKADAYGHGAVQCVRALADEGASWFAVSQLREAVQLRREVLRDPDRFHILILGYTDPAMAALLLEYGLTQTCHSLDYARALSAAAANDRGQQVMIHLKADTGMGRIGYALRTDFDRAVAEMRDSSHQPHLTATGMFQHFAAADELAGSSVEYTARQHALFCRAVQQVLPWFGEPEAAVLHCGNSAGVMLHPDWPAGLPPRQCMARPGIILYGFDPSSELRFGSFRPVMKLKTVVSQVKTLQPGQSVSYGRHFTAGQPTRVATLCAGYADGYPRLLSGGKGVVELHGKPAPVLGNVCMDQMLVDVTGIPGVQPGDEAILWGGAASDSAETVAEKTGTISYEVLCGVSRRVPRVYLDHGEPVAVDDFLNGSF